MLCVMEKHNHCSLGSVNNSELAILFHFVVKSTRCCLASSGWLLGVGVQCCFVYRIGVSYFLIRFCGDMCCWSSERWVGHKFFSQTARAGRPINDMALGSNTRIEHLAV